MVETRIRTLLIDRASIDTDALTPLARNRNLGDYIAGLRLDLTLPALRLLAIDLDVGGVALRTGNNVDAETWTCHRHALGGGYVVVLCDRIDVVADEVQVQACAHDWRAGSETGTTMRTTCHRCGREGYGLQRLRQLSDPCDQT